VLVILTALAFWVRVDGLQGWDGTLTVDEARLALAARGVLETGLPRLPSGWVYTRGLLATYLVVPSLAFLGESDFAARLPSILEGVALIPVAYLLGREVSRRAGGLFVAALLAGHPSFVIWSRQAWFYALYVLLFAAALLFVLRAHRTGRDRDQVLAAVLVGLTLFAHEVGVFLVVPLSVQVLARLWSDRQHPGRWRAPMAAGAVVGLAGVVLWLLTTMLRADSLVGSYGEIQEYLSPSAEWPRIRFYVRMLLDGPGLLVAAAAMGIPFAVVGRRLDTLLLWLALLPAFLHAAFLIPRGPQERYGLTLVLVIAVLAAQGVWLAAQAAGRRLRWPAPRLTLATSAIFVGMLLAHQDVGRAVERAALSPREGAWLRQARELGIGPTSLVMTDVPTTVAWYIGGLDYWVTSREYEKYATRQDDFQRDVHTGAVIVRSRAEVERLVARAHPGEELWVIASGRSYQWGELVEDELKGYIERSAARRLNPGDNYRILLLSLPSGY
jgi:4-amino-4-deoxy-L-arabinose transferase-like glycosyltransferase